MPLTFLYKTNPPKSANNKGGDAIIVENICNTLALAKTTIQNLTHNY